MHSKHQFIVEGDKDEFSHGNWSSSTNGLPKRAPATNLDILIVGAGFSGLMTALECWRNGHNVVAIMERSKGPVYTGDLIVIQPSALRVFRHWPDMLEDLERDRVEAPTYYRRHNGEYIYGPTGPTYNDPEHLAERKGLPFVAPVQIRKRFFRMLLRQVARLGIPIAYGQRIAKYFEEGTHGGVVTEDGSVRIADLVVAADAFKSRSELLIAGEHMPTRSSGMSVYRTSFPTEYAMQHSAFKERWGELLDSGKDQKEFWLGPGMHIGMYLSPETVAWGITPRDQFLLAEGSEPVESWDADVDPEDVVKVLKRIPDWDPAIVDFVRAAPKGGVVHWPLLWRNLRPEWTSKEGRVVQVGDCAHSNVPSSLSGGTMALEDAVTLAACLQLSCSAGGGKNAPLGARIYNLLRYQRVSCAQKMSFVNSQVMGATDWDQIKKDPIQVRLRFPKWVFRHDPEQYVFEKYGQAFAHLVFGNEFENTNYPPGHVFKAWTIEEIHRDLAAGKGAVDFLDGDWS